MNIKKYNKWPMLVVLACFVAIYTNLKISFAEDKSYWIYENPEAADNPNNPPSKFFKITKDKKGDLKAVQIYRTNPKIDREESTTVVKVHQQKNADGKIDYTYDMGWLIEISPNGDRATLTTSKYKQNRSGQYGAHSVPSPVQLRKISEKDLEQLLAANQNRKNKSLIGPVYSFQRLLGEVEKTTVKTSPDGKKVYNKKKISPAEVNYAHGSFRDSIEFKCTGIRFGEKGEETQIDETYNLFFTKEIEFLPDGTCKINGGQLTKKYCIECVTQMVGIQLSNRSENDWSWFVAEGTKKRLILTDVNTTYPTIISPKGQSSIAYEALGGLEFEPRELTSHKAQDFRGRRD